MSYSVELSENFKIESKKLIKRFPSLVNELAELFDILAKNPKYGTQIGKNIYKIRISIASKNKGKSGGGRVLSFVQISGERVLLFAIYNKGDIDNLTDKEISVLLKDAL